MSLVDDVYILTSKLPVFEQYALSSQMRRSVVSIPSNIAEGQGRQTNKEFINFLYIANGSRCELETQLSIAVRQNYITKEQAKPVYTECQEIGKMLTKLIQSLCE